MFEEEIKVYEETLNEYRNKFALRMDAADLEEYNEILFSAHSCAIEGNSFSVDDTRELKERGLALVPKGKSLYEAFEILGHFKAYEYLFGQKDAPLTEDLLKATHRILTEHTLPFKCPGSVPGEYTDTDMCAGETVFGDHEQLLHAYRRYCLLPNRLLTVPACTQWSWRPVSMDILSISIHSAMATDE